MASARRTSRAYERLNSRKSAKHLQISVLRKIPDQEGKKDTFLVENNSKEEAFQKPPSKLSRLETLRQMRDGKSFKKLSSERKSNLPVPRQQLQQLPNVPKMNHLKCGTGKTSLPLLSVKHKPVFRCASLRNEGSTGLSRNSIGTSKVPAKEKANETRTVKPIKPPSLEKKSISENGLTKLESLESPDFPSDISCIHPLSKFTFAPDDFSFTVPESVKKLPSFFLQQIDKGLNLSRMSTPMPNKVSSKIKTEDKGLQSTRSPNATSSKCSTKSTDPSDKNQKKDVPSKRTSLSVTKNLGNEKDPSPKIAVAKLDRKHNLPKPKEANKALPSIAQRAIRVSGVFNNSQKKGSQISKVGNLSGKTFQEKVLPTKGCSRNGLSRQPVLPKSNTTYVNGLKGAVGSFNKTQHFDNSSRKALQPVNSNFKAGRGLIKKPSPNPPLKSIKPPPCKEKTIEQPKSELNRFIKAKIISPITNSSIESDQAEKNITKTQFSTSYSDSSGVQSGIDNDDATDSLPYLSQNSAINVLKSCDESSVSIVSNGNALEAAVAETKQNIQKVSEEKTADSVHKRDCDDTVINQQEAAKPDSVLLKRQKITWKDMQHSNLSFTTTCFIEDEVLDLDISTELAALDLSSTINLFSRCNLRRTGTPLRTPLVKKESQVKSNMDSSWSCERKRIPCSFLTSFSLNSPAINLSNSSFNISGVDINENIQASPKLRADSSPETGSNISKNLECVTQLQHNGNCSGRRKSESELNKTGLPEEIQKSNGCEISLLGSPVKPSRLVNTSIKGDLITFSPIVKKMF